MKDPVGLGMEKDPVGLPVGRVKLKDPVGFGMLEKVGFGIVKVGFGTLNDPVGLGMPGKARLVEAISSLSLMSTAVGDGGREKVGRPVKLPVGRGGRPVKLPVGRVKLPVGRV